MTTVPRQSIPISLPRISVVVPSYNQAAYLPATLDSLLNQGYPDLEILLMDGGSTDGSAGVMDAYASRLAVAVSERDRGQAHAINKGMARATGEVLTWLNSDDVLLPGALQAVGAIFEAFQAVRWLTGRPVNLGPDGRLRYFPVRTGRFQSLIRRGLYHGRAFGFIRQEGTFWRRSLWERAGGGLDEARHYSLDYTLWRQFAEFAPLVTVDQALAAFRQHPAQKTANLDDYYAEAEIGWPQAARLLMLPTRVALGPVSWALTPHVTRAGSSWTLHGLNDEGR